MLIRANNQDNLLDSAIIPLLEVPGRLSLNPRNPLRRYLALVVAMCIAAMPAPGSQQPSADDDLTIQVVEGNDFVNNIRQRTARDPVVEVRDRNKRPLAGVLVTFKLPVSGPGGTFSNGLQTISVTTDSAGRAAGTGFQPNSVTGRFRIDVQAEHQGRTARTSLNGRNVKSFKFGIKSTVTVAAVAAAAAIVAAVVVSNNGGNGRTGTGVTIGQPTIGPR